jgi:hypothetical protein
VDSELAEARVCDSLTLLFVESWGHKTIILMAMDSQLDSSMGHGVGAYAPNTLEQERERLVPVIKEFRKDIDALIQRAARGKEIGSSNYDVERVREEVSKKTSRSENVGRKNAGSARQSVSRRTSRQSERTIITIAPSFQRTNK